MVHVISVTRLENPKSVMRTYAVLALQKTDPYVRVCWGEGGGGGGRVM
jgi:hypothetical protein